MGNELKPWCPDCGHGEEYHSIQCDETFCHECDRLAYNPIHTLTEVNRSQATESADTTRDALVKAREALKHYADADTWRCGVLIQDTDGTLIARTTLEAIEAAIAEEGKENGDIYKGD